MPKTCPVCGTSYADGNVFCPGDGTTLIAEATGADLVGSVIADRYLVSALLGEGGMGRVYLARHVRLPQQAAIKVLHPGMVSDPEAVARFNREAANAARIEHDRVARVFDFGETRDGSVYLAMEYVPGRTLRAILDDEGRLSPVRAAQVTLQVAEGLDAAHRIGIVHRDLKPDNIMIVTDEQGVDRCKVVDFGIAKAADCDSQTRLTRTGTVVGTPEYMSPEQVLGEPIDARSDVYALALVAYNMLTGVLPFSGTTPERAFAARLIEDPRPLGVAAPGTDWPSELQVAMDRALDRDPATRTPSALEFADAVVAAVEGWTGTSVHRSRTPLSSRSITPGTNPAITPSGPLSPVPSSRGITAVAPQVLPPAVPAPAPPVVQASTERRRTRSPLVFAAGGITIAVAAWALFLRTPASFDPASPITRSADSGVGTAPARAPNAPATPGGAAKGGGPVRSAESVVAPGGAAIVPGNDARATEPSGSGITPPEVSRELDSLVRVLEDPDTDDTHARAAIPALVRVMKQLGTATDSTWAWLALVSAYGQAGETLRACPALRNAQRLATTAAQRSAISNYFSSPALSCVP